MFKWISAGGWIDKSAALKFVVHTSLFLLYVRSQNMNQNMIS